MSEFDDLYDDDLGSLLDSGDDDSVFAAIEGRRKRRKPAPVKRGRATVTAGPITPVGIEAKEIARLASEGPLDQRIRAAFTIGRNDDLAKRAAPEVRRRTAPNLVESLADVALSQLPVVLGSGGMKAADLATETALDRYAEGGGDPGAHANAFGAAGALGDVAAMIATAVGGGENTLLRGASLPQRSFAAAKHGAANMGALGTVGGATLGSDTEAPGLVPALKEGFKGAVTGAVVGPAFTAGSELVARGLAKGISTVGSTIKDLNLQNRSGALGPRANRQGDPFSRSRVMGTKVRTPDGVAQTGDLPVAPSTPPVPAALGEENLARVAAGLAKRVQDKGGFTFDPHTGKFVAKGFAVALGKSANVEPFVVSELTPETIGDFLTKNQHFFAENPEVKIGAWKDDASGKIYLEPSQVVPDRKTAVALGRERQELAVGDLGKYARGEDGTISLESVRFEHRSPVAGLETLSGQFQGSNPNVKGAERARANRTGRVYVQDIGSELEPEFRSPALHRYEVEVPKGQLYDVSTDPDGIVAKIGGNDPDRWEKAIEKAGYAGYYASGYNPHYKALFGDTPVLRDEGGLGAALGSPAPATPLAPPARLNTTRSQTGPVAKREAHEIEQLLARRRTSVQNAGYRNQINRAIRVGLPDVLDALKTQSHATEWYRADMGRAEQVLGQMIPELRDPTNRQLFRALLAITSSGQNPAGNLKSAIGLFEKMQRTGDLSGLSFFNGPRKRLPTRWEGTVDRSIPSSKRYHAYEDGLNKLRNFLGEDRSQWSQKLEQLWAERKTVTHRQAGTKETISFEQPLAAEMFGPKIGRYYANLSGVADDVTVDVWAARTLRSWLGYAPEGSGAPSDVEGNVMRAAIAQLAQKASQVTGREYKPFEIQAALWYYEKQRFSNLGYVDRHGQNSYADAAAYVRDRRAASGPAGRAPVGARDAGDNVGGGATPDGGGAQGDLLPGRRSNDRPGAGGLLDEPAGEPAGSPAGYRAGDRGVDPANRAAAEAAAQARAAQSRRIGEGPLPPELQSHTIRAVDMARQRIKQIDRILRTKQVPGIPNIGDLRPASRALDQATADRIKQERRILTDFLAKQSPTPQSQPPRSNSAETPEWTLEIPEMYDRPGRSDLDQTALLENMLEKSGQGDAFELARSLGYGAKEPRLKNRGGYLDLTGKPQPNEPEFIDAPAFRAPDGKIYTGAVHVLAREEARKAGSLPHGVGSGGGEDGFLTSTGRFVDRVEAGRIAGFGDDYSLDATDGTPLHMLDALDLPTNQRARTEAAEVKSNEPQQVEFKSYGRSSNPNALTGRLQATDGSWVINLDPTEAAKIPGLRGEESRIRPETVEQLTASMRESGFDPAHAVAIDVVDGKPFVYEGNHRIRAAAALGLPVPAEVRYIGNTPTGWRPVLAGESPKRLKNRPGFLSLGGKQPQLPNRSEGTGTPFKAKVDVTEDERALSNIAKLNLSPEAEAKVREAYQRLDLSKKTVTHEETQAVASELGLNPSRLLDKEGRLSGAELLAVRDVISSNAQRVVDLSAEANKPNLSVDEKQAILDEIGKLTNQNDEFLKRYTRSREQTGRDLNALKIIARNSLDPSVWLLQAERLKGLPLTQAEHVLVSQLAAAKDRDGLIRAVAGMRKTSAGDKLITLWKAGLLTALGTHTANLSGNAAMAVTESVKDVPATMIDALISLARGTERTKAPSVKGLVVEPVKGFFGPGLKAARRVLKYGSDPDQLAKWDFRKVNYGDSPAGRIAQAYTDVIFNSLGAEDQLFRAAAFGRSIEEQARLAAKGNKQLLAQLRQQPTPEMMVQAIADAELAVFQNENLAASAVSATRRGLREKGKAGEQAAIATEFVAPFVKTPSNIIARTIEYSPPGLIFNTGKLAKALAKGIESPDQKRLADALGRGITGSSTLFLLGFMLAREGKATGSFPKDPKERSQMELEGKVSNGVLVGDTWRSFARLGPPGMVIAAGAQSYEAFANSETTSGKLAGALYAPVRAGLDQSFLKGVSGALDALNDPARAGERFLESTAGSVVPSGIAQVARATDPYARETRGIGSAIKGRIPGLRQTLPARLNAFGKPVAEGNFIADMLDPTRPTPASKDPLIRALTAAGASVGMPSRSVTGPDRVRRTLSDEEYRQLMQDVGPKTERALRELFEAGLFTDSRETPDDRQEAVSQTVSKVRASASRRRRAREAQTASNKKP